MITQQMDLFHLWHSPLAIFFGFQDENFNSASQHFRAWSVFMDITYQLNYV